jgi:hypothetical protein
LETRRRDQQRSRRLPLQPADFKFGQTLQSVRRQTAGPFPEHQGNPISLKPSTPKGKCLE